MLALVRSHAGDTMRNHSGENTIVAIDAPSIILNETGQRACETAVGKRYGNRHASCHTSNMTLYLIRLVSLLRPRWLPTVLSTLKDQRCTRRAALSLRSIPTRRWSPCSI